MHQVAKTPRLPSLASATAGTTRCSRPRAGFAAARLRRWAAARFGGLCGAYLDYRAARTRLIAAAAVTAIAGAQLDRLGARGWIGFEAGDDFLRQRLLDQLFNIFEHDVLIDADQRYRFAGGAGPAGTADPMHIVFRHVRQVVVDHVRQ